MLANASDSLKSAHDCEVLRCPKGTLYGKNTSGEAVNRINRMPETVKIDG